MKWFFDAGERKAAAFFALLIGAVVMTVYAVAVLFLVRQYPYYSFWLGIAAHVQIAIVTTGFVAFFVKRTVKVSREGVEWKDSDNGASNNPDTK